MEKGRKLLYLIFSRELALSTFVFDYVRLIMSPFFFFLSYIFPLEDSIGNVTKMGRSDSEINL